MMPLTSRRLCAFINSFQAMDSLLEAFLMLWIPSGSVGRWDLHGCIELPGSLLNPGSQFKDILKQGAADLLTVRWGPTSDFPQIRATAK
jgi:hypothetical protein